MWRLFGQRGPCQRSEIGRVDSKGRGCLLGEVELDGTGVEDGLAGFEDDAAAGCDGHGGYAAVVVGGVAADEGGGDVGYGTVGLEVVGLADILPGGGAADGVEGVWYG